MVRNTPQALRILLVEDLRSEAILLEKTLTQIALHAYQITNARTIAEALPLIESNAFDVVLLDLGLPDAQGLSGLHAVQAAAPKMPVIILTGYEDREMEMQALEQGAQDYVVKGRISLPALNRSMRHAIQRKAVENMKSEFISVISHELRTPLTSIHGALGLINGSLSAGLPPEVVRLLDIASRNSERLIALVSEILDTDNIDSGQADFNIHSEPLVPLLRCAVDASAVFAQRYSVTYHLDPVSPALMVEADGGRLIQVLGNLLSNAAKFSPDGGEVRVRAVRHDGRIRISVADRGVGIRHEFRDRIFRKFSQSDTAITRRVGGVGLGLYVSKQIIERMGGRIGFDSEPGEGATFWLDLPAGVTAHVRAREVS